MDIDPRRNTSMGPVTEYFEIDSKRVGTTFAVWVTLPIAYHMMPVDFPIVYVTDGNTNLPVTAPLSFSMMGDEARPADQFLQVTVGYTGLEAQRMAITRNRDLVPPGEPYPPALEGNVAPMYESGMFSAEDRDEFLESSKHGRADNFLAFLTEELHPEILGRYRATSEGAGLFGTSYGGLFTLYALIAGNSLFQKYGAGSPGILSDNSVIFTGYSDLVARAEAERRNLELHITFNDHEALGSNKVYRAVSRNALRFFDTHYETPVPGLTLTGAIILGENHFSGIVDSYRSFIRHCYTASR
ncbi:alpha/beta hydrolase [Gordonia sp. NPDC003424]